MQLTFLRRPLDLCGKTLDLTFVWEPCPVIVSEGNLTCMGETLFNCRKIRKKKTRYEGGNLLDGGGIGLLLRAW
jgi:hypothetical protein